MFGEFCGESPSSKELGIILLPNLMVFPNRPCSVISPSYGLICRTFSSNPNREFTSIFSYKKFSDLFLSVCVPLVPGLTPALTLCGYKFIH